MRKDAKGRDLFDEVLDIKELNSLLNKTFDIFTGVPDSMFGLILPDLKEYIPAPRENHAVAIAFGVAIAGKKPCVLLQNSGIGLCADALLGLQRLHEIGVVLVVTQRGELEWEEIQHHDWGKCTCDVLKALDIEIYDYEKLGATAITEAQKKAQNGKITAILMHRGNVREPS